MHWGGGWEAVAWEEASAGEAVVAMAPVEEEETAQEKGVAVSVEEAMGVVGMEADGLAAH